jgi:hypothetical protein
MQICTKCGRTFHEEIGGLYCPYDGQALIRSESIVCPACHGETDADGRYCGRCGALLVSLPSQYIRNLTSWLAQSWRLYWTNFLTIAAVLIIVDLPYCLAARYMWQSVDMSTPNLGVLRAFVLDVTAGLALGALITAAIILRLAAHLRNEKPALGELFEGAFEIWPRLLWNRFKAFLLIVLGAILFIIPGLFLLVRYAFVDYVVTLERNTARSPLAISKQIGENFGWKIFGYYLLVLLIYVAAEVLLLWGLISKNLESTSWVYALKQVVADLVLEFSTVSLFVLYLGLRAVKVKPYQVRSTPVEPWNPS